MPFPTERPRRLRRTGSIRALVRETHLTPDQLILPLFCEEGIEGSQPISAMPGQARMDVPHIVEEVKKAQNLGIGAVLFFGVPNSKDDKGSRASDSDGIVHKALKACKEACPDMPLIVDVCLCAYTDHGHCGIWENGQLQNDSSLEQLAAMAISLAKAGADWVAPSSMLDGQVEAIREGLDSADCQDTAILSYSAKYASAFYGPFREAADSAPEGGTDRSGYQMDPANAREAIREVQLDIDEGADAVMVKPALPYLDIISDVAGETDLPVAAYHVSGSFAMVHAAADKGWLDLDRTMKESLTAIRRAGADLIITYYAREAAQQLREGTW